MTSSNDHFPCETVLGADASEENAVCPASPGQQLAILRSRLLNFGHDCQTRTIDVEAPTGEIISLLDSLTIAIGSLELARADAEARLQGDLEREIQRTKQGFISKGDKGN